MTTINTPNTWQTLYEQAETACHCLQEKWAKTQDSKAILPYLIHAAILFFTARDYHAFLLIQQAPGFKDSNLPVKLRQMPSFTQLNALLASNEATKPLTDQIKHLSDEALGVSELKQFRDCVIQQGVPLETTDSDTPFPLPVVNYGQLTQDILRAWTVLKHP